MRFHVGTEVYAAVMTISIGMVTIDSTDPAPLAAWWAERLGVEVLTDSDGWFYILDGTPRVAVQKVDDPTPGKNRIHLDFACTDLGADRDALLAAGATLVGERGDDSFRWITFADPQGNEFCIAQH